MVAGLWVGQGFMLCPSQDAEDAHRSMHETYGFKRNKKTRIKPKKSFIKKCFFYVPRQRPVTATTSESELTDGT